MNGWAIFRYATTIFRYAAVAAGLFFMVFFATAAPVAEMGAPVWDGKVLLLQFYFFDRINCQSFTGRQLGDTITGNGTQ